MKRFFLLLMVISQFSCSKKENDNFKLITYLPQNSEIILISPDFPGFITNLNKNRFISESDFNFKKQLQGKLEFLPHLGLNNETGLSLSNITEDHFIYTLITEKDSSFINLDSVQNKSVESITEGQFKFQKISIDENTFFLFEGTNSNIISNSRENLRKVADQQEILKDESFKKAFAASDPEKTSVFLRNSSTSKHFQKLFTPFGFSNLDILTEWSVVDLDISEADIKVNGINLPGNENKIQDIFEGNNARLIESTEIVPDDFTGLYAFSYENFSRLHKELATFKKDSTNTKYPAVLDKTRELANLILPEGSALILNASEIESARETMAGMGSQTQDFRSLPIFTMDNKEEFSSLFSPLLQTGSYNYYTFIDHFIVLSNKISVLEHMISAHQNSDLITKSEYYSRVTNSLSSQSSMLFLMHTNSFTSGISEESSANISIQKNSIAALQFIQESGFAHIHGIFNNDTQAKQNSTKDAEQSLSIKIKAPIVTEAYFFKNHRTDQMDIAVQDENNVLYLISNKGNIYWKKQLDSQITSPIYQVDLFKNGNQQLAFSTGYQLDVLDRNGNRVKPFPIKFNDPLTQPLAVFDYDNNRNYRFVLTQNRKIYMVGPRGKAISGFDFNTAGSEIIKPPKHIRLGNKDYILIAEKSGKLNILSRQGNIRIPLKEKIDFSENEWFGNDNRFISSAPKDKLISIDQNGKIAEQSVGLAENNRLTANSETLVYLNDNELYINGKTVTLDYGLYTSPQVFSMSRADVVAITDTQTQKVFVFNDKAELLNGFPVYGTSKVDISNADIDPNPELIVKGEEDEILLYEFSY